MLRFRSILASTIFTIASAVNLSIMVLGQRDHEFEPVGGVTTAANKLAIIAPYLVLAGIVVVASAVYIKRRKH
jgi:hypothetical protein